jgi:uncharacterized Zn finger protein
MSVRLKRKAKGERPIFFADPSVDKVIAMVMGLAGEVAVMRDRLDTLERLLAHAGVVSRSAIDDFKISSTVAVERAHWRESFLSEVLRVVEIELEAVASGDQAPYQDAIALVERDAAGGVAVKAKLARTAPTPRAKMAAKKPRRT